jgi:hypothetical protein
MLASRAIVFLLELLRCAFVGAPLYLKFMHKKLVKSQTLIYTDISPPFPSSCQIRLQVAHCNKRVARWYLATGGFLSSARMSLTKLSLAGNN